MTRWARPPFRDRHHAGRELAAMTAPLADDGHAVVLGLARGGVVVAAEVANALSAPLDVMVVGKVGAPGRPELAMGAVAPDGITIRYRPVLDFLDLAPTAFDEAAEAARAELGRKEERYRGVRPPVSVSGRTVVLVDDGLATGSTMWAAIAAARSRGASGIVVALPVAVAAACEELRAAVDEVVCVVAPATLGAVGSFYEDFTQVSDEEVQALLAEAPAG
jgi:predicted phosphoribosyltransferase